MASGLRPAVFLLLAGASVVTPADPPPRTYRYHPKYRAPPSLESILLHLEPGHDAFPEEKDAEELEGRLKELRARLRARPPRAAEAVDTLAAPEFRGARLTPNDEISTGTGPQLEIFRARAVPTELTLDQRRLPPGAGRAGGAISNPSQTAELLITGIELERAPEPTSPARRCATTSPARRREAGARSGSAAGG